MTCHISLRQPWHSHAMFPSTQIMRGRHEGVDHLDLFLQRYLEAKYSPFTWSWSPTLKARVLATRFSRFLVVFYSKPRRKGWNAALTLTLLPGASSMKCVSSDVLWRKSSTPGNGHTANSLSGVDGRRATDNMLCFVSFLPLWVGDRGGGMCFPTLFRGKKISISPEKQKCLNHCEHIIRIVSTCL